MNEKSPNKFIAFLKLFCPRIGMYLIGTFIAYEVIMLIDTSINFRYSFKMTVIGCAIGVSFGYLISALINMDKYIKYSIKIEYDAISYEELKSKLQKTMKKGRWNIIKNENNQIVFKSSFWGTILPEYITININENNFEIIGYQLYVEMIVKKLKKLKIFLNGELGI